MRLSGGDSSELVRIVLEFGKEFGLNSFFILLLLFHKPPTTTLLHVEELAQLVGLHLAAINLLGVQLVWENGFEKWEQNCSTLVDFLPPFCLHTS